MADELVMLVEQLGDRAPDYLAALARAGLGAVPFVGSAAAEGLSFAIRNQRMDRLEHCARAIVARLLAVTDEQRRLAGERVRTPEGLGLLEETFVQAQRAVSEERRRRLASILTNGFTAEEFKGAECEKMLRLLADLTDEEVIFLTYWSLRPGSELAAAFRKRHQKTLAQVSRQIGASLEDRDRAALEDSYYTSLVRMGLVREGDQGPGAKLLTGLGRLFLRYIEAAEAEVVAAAESETR
jgi:hypothetical protein